MVFIIGFVKACFERGLHFPHSWHIIVPFGRSGVLEVTAERCVYPSGISLPVLVRCCTVAWASCWPASCDSTPFLRRFCHREENTRDRKRSEGLCSSRKSRLDSD